MNYQSLLEAIEASARTVGYTPTAHSSLHATLREEGFPIATIAPLRLLESEGTEERVRLYGVNMKFLSANELSDEDRARLISRMALQVEAFVGLVREALGVLSVEVQEMVVQEQSVTVAGEVALALKMEVRCVECIN